MGYYYTQNTMSRAVRADRGTTSHKHNRKVNQGRGEVLQGWAVDDRIDDDGGGIEAWSKRRTLQDGNGRNKDRPKKAQPVPWDSYIIHTGTKCHQIENVNDFQEASLPEKFRPKKLHLDLNFASNKEQPQTAKQQTDPTEDVQKTNVENKPVKIKLSLSKGVLNGANTKNNIFNHTSKIENQTENKIENNGVENETVVDDNKRTKHVNRPPDEHGLRLSYSETDLVKAQVTSNTDCDDPDYQPRSSNSSPSHQVGSASRERNKTGSPSDAVAAQTIKLCYSHSQSNLMPRKKTHLSGITADHSNHQLHSKSEDNIITHANDPVENQETYVLISANGLKGQYSNPITKDSKSQYKRQVTLILNKVSFDNSAAFANPQVNTTKDNVEDPTSDLRIGSAQSKHSRMQLDVTNIGLKDSNHNHILYDNNIAGGIQNNINKQVTFSDYLPAVEPNSSRSLHPGHPRLKQVTVPNGLDLDNADFTLYADNMLFPRNEVKMMNITDSIHQFLGPPAFHPFQNRTPLQRARDNAQKKMFGLLQNSSSELDPSRRHKRWASASSKMYPSTRMSAPSKIEFKTTEPSARADRVVTPGSSERIKSSKSRDSPISKYSVSSVYQSLPYKTSLHNLYKLSQKRRDHTQEQDPALQALEKAREKLHSNVWKRNNTTTISQESTTISRM